MLSGEGNARERWKTTIGLISKKQLCMCSTLFLYISLPLFYTTTTWNFQKLLSYTFYGGNIVRVLVHFFFTAAHFHLALVAACISHIVTAATKSLQKRKNSASEESEGVWGGWGLRSSAAFSPPQSISLLASLAYSLPVSSRFLPFPPHYAAWSQANVMMVLQ